MLLSEGQMSDYKGAALMLDALPKAKALLGDRGYDAAWFREALADRNVVLRAFYGIYPLFAYLCVGAELTWVALYVLAHEPDFAVGPLRLVDVTTYVFAPACVMKNVVNLAQFGSAAQNLAIRDMERKEKAR